MTARCRAGVVLVLVFGRFACSSVAGTVGGAAGELDERVERVRLVGLVPALGPRGLEQLVHDRPMRSPERQPRVSGPAGDHVPGTLGVGELLERPRRPDPLVCLLAILAPGPQALVAHLGQRRILRTGQQVGLGFRRDVGRGRDRLGLRNRQLPAPERVHGRREVRDLLRRLQLTPRRTHRRPRDPGQLIGSRPEPVALPPPRRRPPAEPTTTSSTRPAASTTSSADYRSVTSPNGTASGSILATNTAKNSSISRTSSARVRVGAAATMRRTIQMG